MIKIALDWKDYEIIASGGGQKLERWDKLVLLRPDPQAIWDAPFELAKYDGINAVYCRSSSGGGRWQIKGGVPDGFNMSRKDLKFACKLMGFKHTGLFPEQAVNWDLMSQLIKSKTAKPKVLNLFAYTGGATVACAKAGASVCHVDSAKAMVERAKQNCELSGVERTNTRFIIDDCMKFVEKETRRGNRYDAVIMDPPSYGRGANGETWKLEDNLYALVKSTLAILSEKPAFYLINSYTTGLQPTVIKNIIDLNLTQFKGSTDAYELGLATNDKNVIMPCGCSGFWTSKN